MREYILVLQTKLKKSLVEAENKALTSEEVLSNFINKNIGNLLILNKKSDGTGFRWQHHPRKNQEVRVL